jgi:tripartite-type tricarboxylate transporter receptor subunit TctC
MGEMQMPRILAAFIVIAAALGSAIAAQAQSYPSKPITLTIGFPAGGPSDTAARIIGEHMKGTLGQPIVVESVTGAGATIAGAKVARAAPDGYNIILGNWTSHVGGGAIYPLNYHVMNDFEPISLLPASYLWIIGRSDLPANNVKELVAWLKANPGKATAATVGVGSAAQMCLVDFANKSGTTFQYIPYRGGAPAVRDLLGKQVDFGCLEVSQTLPHVAAGNLKPFGVVAKKRSPAAPNTPTLAEGGVPNVELIFWQALWAPKGTPKPVIDTLNAAVRKALADPAVQKRFATLGQDIPTSDEQTPEALAKHHKAELDKWWPVMKAAGIKAPPAR